MKATEIRNMTKDEIIKNLSDLRDEHFKLRMRRSNEEIPNPVRLRLIRRDIARLETILKEIKIKGEENVVASSVKTSEKHSK